MLVNTFHGLKNLPSFLPVMQKTTSQALKRRYGKHAGGMGSRLSLNRSQASLQGAEGGLLMSPGGPGMETTGLAPPGGGLEMAALSKKKQENGRVLARDNKVAPAHVPGIVIEVSVSDEYLYSHSVQQATTLTSQALQVPLTF